MKFVCKKNTPPPCKNALIPSLNPVGICAHFQNGGVA